MRRHGKQRESSRYLGEKNLPRQRIINERDGAKQIGHRLDKGINQNNIISMSSWKPLILYAII